MSLFPPTFLDNIENLPGAAHSFLKHLSQPQSKETREWIEALSQSVPPSLRNWWTDQLMSLDNRRFFQAFSEIITAQQLLERQWSQIEMDWPGPVLRARSPSGRLVDIMVLAFVRPLRPTLDRSTREQLIRTLNRVHTKSRISVLVKRWLHHDFDPDPIRRSIELWLGEVDRGAWDSRYASYEDEHISLEFALTGEACSDEQPPVAFSLGPLDGQHLVEALETRLIYHLDSLRMSSEAEPRPLLVNCVMDQPWDLSPGHLRDLLLGRPSRLAVLESGLMEQTFSNHVTASVFRDPLYRHVCGVWMSERRSQSPLSIRNRVFMNPWAHEKIEASQLPGDHFSVHRWEEKQAVMRWSTTGI